MIKKLSKYIKENNYNFDSFDNFILSECNIELWKNTPILMFGNNDKVFSLDLVKEGKTIDSELEDFINEKIALRAEAKKNKDFALADSIRDELLEKGISLLDTREGTKFEIN